MKRPGFALLHYDGDTRTVSVVRTSVVNNKNKDKPHGQMLGENAKELRTYLEQSPDAILVREQALSMIGKSAKTIMTLNKMVGVSDLYAWAFGQRVFQEVHPKTVKKWVSGYGLEEKDGVAAALEKYVGPREYQFDDESDAVAVGVAWLIQNGYIKSEGE